MRGTGNTQTTSGPYKLKEGEQVLMVTHRGAQGAVPADAVKCRSGFDIIEQLPALNAEGKPVGGNAVVIIGRRFS